jgi:hypothetical protein
MHTRSAPDTCATGMHITRSASHMRYGNFLLVACYPQRMAYVLRVAILGTLRVSFFLVVSLIQKQSDFDSQAETCVIHVDFAGYPEATGQPMECCAKVGTGPVKNASSGMSQLSRPNGTGVFLGGRFFAKEVIAYGGSRRSLS